MWGVKFDYTRKCDKHGRGNGAWNSNLRRMCFYGGVQKRRRRIYPLQKCGNGWPTYAEDWRSCEKLHIMTYQVSTPSICTIVIQYIKYILDIRWIVCNSKLQREMRMHFVNETYMCDVL